MFYLSIRLPFAGSPRHWHWNVSVADLPVVFRAAAEVTRLISHVDAMKAPQLTQRHPGDLETRLEFKRETFPNPVRSKFP